MVDHYRLLVESVKDYAIFILDPAGHITTWNEGAQRIKGYLAAEIVGEHFSVFYPAEDVAGCDTEEGVCTWYGRTTACEPVAETWTCSEL